MNLKKSIYKQAAVICLVMPLIVICKVTSASDTRLIPIINFLLEDNNPFGLDPNLPPWENFDLSDWGLDSPALRQIDAPSSSSNFERGVRIEDFEFVALNQGPSSSGFTSAFNNFFGTGTGNDNFEATSPYFYTGSDGGMVFKSPVNGGRTSTNTRFPRSELREMLRAGNRAFGTQGVNENNWALGYQPQNLSLGAHANNNATAIGGRNGKLTATLRVNQVTSTGRNSRVGRVIIGQIHADDDEPLRLYYRKLPQNERGGIYFVHEIRGGDDLDNFDIVGSSANPPSNDPYTGPPFNDPANGIALDELFSYEISNVGSLITVIIRRGDRDGEIIGQETIDMAQLNSGYDLADEWMYFKAGAYSQNNTEVSTNRTDGRGAATTGFGVDIDGDGIGDEPDYDQATFYRIENTHD